MNRLTFKSMNYPIDRTIDAAINQALDSGILDIREGDLYYIHIRFKDKSEIYAWNVNRWYAWLNKGWFKYPVNEEKYYWQDARPKRKTMVRLMNALSSFRYVA